MTVEFLKLSKPQCGQGLPKTGLNFRHSTLAREPHLMRNSCKCATCLKLREQGRGAPLHCACGGTWRVDGYRRSREHNKAGCTCDGYGWSIFNGVHRRGSVSVEGVCIYAEVPVVE